jgi:hypothetical protein
MSTVKKPKFVSPDPYPKAPTRKPTGGSKTRVKSKPTVSSPNSGSGGSLAVKPNVAKVDRFQSGGNGLDPDLERMKNIKNQNFSSGGPELDLGQDYPTSGGRKSGPGIQDTGVIDNGSPTKPKPPTGPRPPRQPVPPESPSSGPRTPQAPNRTRTRTRTVHPKTFKHEMTILEAAQKKQAKADADLAARRAKANQKAPDASPPAKASAPMSTNRAYARGTIGASAGVLDVVMGADKIINGGDKVEGVLQIGQGSTLIAEGYHTVNMAEKGIDAAKTPKGKLLAKAGIAFNAGMAAYDVKQSYDAFQSGNNVAAADEASSAVINAVSAFPPTAVIGLVGGLADWGMAASGADQAMINYLNRDVDQAFADQAKEMRPLALSLLQTESSELSRMPRADRLRLSKGVSGLYDLRKVLLAEGRVDDANQVFQHTQRVKKALAQQP